MEQQAGDKNGFSLLELVVVVAVLAILAAIGIPMFISIIKQAAYAAGQWSLASARSSCAVNKSASAPTGFFGTQFSSSNSSDICNGSMTATFDGGCQISIDLKSGEKSSSGSDGWPASLDTCSAQALVENKNSKTGKNRNNKSLEAFLERFNSAKDDGTLLEEKYYRRGDSVYVVVKGDTWEQAQENAKKLGGNLATINSKEENEWIASQLYGTGKVSSLLQEKLSLPGEELRGMSVWLGHNDLNSRGTYEAVSGEEDIYNGGWMRGEPGDSQGKDGERYAIMTLFENYNSKAGEWGGVANRQLNTPQLRERGGVHIFYGLAEVTIEE